MARRHLPRLLLLLLCALLWGQSAAAHGYLMRAIPADRSTLERAPTRLQYWFSENLEPRFSQLFLRDASGNVIAEGAVDPNNRALLTLQLPVGALSDGAYIVDLRPVFGDGHAVAQSQVFFVGNAQGSIASQAASDLPLTLEIVWKALLTAGSTLLFGAAGLYVWVFLPAWGSSKYLAGGLPPRVMRRLNAMFGVGLLLSVGANVLALLQQSMAYFGVDAPTVLSGQLWEVVRIGSRFGDVWNAQMLLLLLIGALWLGSLYVRREYPRSVRAFWGAQVWAVALLIGAQAIVSHAAGSLVLAWVALLMHWLHTLAVAFWVGALAGLVIVLPAALQPYAGEARAAALRAAMRRASALLVGVVAVVVLTGIYSSTNWFFSPEDFATRYGATLGVKLLLVGGLLAMGGAHWLALRPKAGGVLARFAQFGMTLRLELLVAGLTVTAASTLSATPLPQPEFLTRDLSAPTAQAYEGNYSVTLTLSPGGVGVNTLDVLVLRDDKPLDAADVRVQFVHPERDLHRREHRAEPVETGLYVVGLGDVDALGAWWTLVDVLPADGEPVRAVATWDVTAESSLIVALPPSPLAVLVALSVAGALVYIALPTLRRWAGKLNFAPQSLFAAGAAIVLTSAVLAFSAWYIEEQGRATSLLENPPPTLFNPILPTQQSLREGRALYEAHCIGWQGVTDFRALINQIETMRDETLFRATQEGWRRMPACQGDLTDEQRWHIVNYARTLRRLFVG